VNAQRSEAMRLPDHFGGQSTIGCEANDGEGSILVVLPPSRQNLFDDQVIMDVLYSVHLPRNLLGFLRLGRAVDEAAQLHNASESLYLNLRALHLFVSIECHFDFVRKGTIVNKFSRAPRRTVSSTANHGYCHPHKTDD
jgi:hypothetical protein